MCLWVVHLHPNFVAVETATNGNLKCVVVRRDLVLGVSTSAVSVSRRRRVAGARRLVAPLRRLAALAGYEKLPLSRSDRAMLTACEATRGALDEGMALSVVAYTFGDAVARDACLLRAMAGAPLPDAWRDQIATGAAATFPVTARDLIARGREPGPALGVELKAMEAKWLASGFTLTLEELL